MPDLTDAEILARLQQWLDDHPATPQPPKSSAQIAAEDYWEGIAEERAHEARWGHVSEAECRRREAAYEDWLTGGAA